MRDLCDNIARMGLQNATNTPRTCEMHDARLMFLCNNARRGLQNATAMHDAWCSSDVFFVTILQGWGYKIQQTCEMRDLCNNIAGIVLQKTQQTREIWQGIQCNMQQRNVRCGLENDLILSY